MTSFIRIEFSLFTYDRTRGLGFAEVLLKRKFNDFSSLRIVNCFVLNLAVKQKRENILYLCIS